MDVAQITGASSSYARKYALNWLFAIDDTKDADTMDNRQGKEEMKIKNNKKEDINNDLIQEFVMVLKESSPQTEEDLSEIVKNFAKENKDKINEATKQKLAETKKLYINKKLKWN